MIRVLSAAAIAVFASSAASAAPAKCSSLHKDISSMGQQLQGLVVKQTKLAEQITVHDDARVSAEQDLSMSGMDASVDSADVLKVKISENSTAATLKREELNSVNVELLALNDKYNGVVTEFNKECVK